MRRRILTTVTLCLGFLIGTALSPVSAADKKAKGGEVNGRVQSIDKDKSTISVMKGNTPRLVVYSADTKWLYGSQGAEKPSSLADLKDNYYIHCKGTFDGVKLVADTCRFREKR
jgi:hypothetical protein